MNANAPHGQDLEQARIHAQEDVRDLRSKISHLGEDEIGLMLTRARSHYAWQDKPVTDEQLKQIYDITKMGSTSMNCCPARFVFVKSAAGKDRLAKALKPTNVPKVMKAPVTAIIAFDKEFWTELPRLFPHEDRRGHFRDKEKHSYDTAFRNSTLQGGYFMMAARAIGLDTGPISGFSNEIVDAEFFAGTTIASNFLCNLGYADESALFQRLPRFDFEDVCEFA
ncbi:malonic semialdehyde reductase [Pararhizobium sp. IMCC21322]|uniref:malonic semialdehyde reductase n=1 Tax=Pararhizobium sp. IMCC21322 TaxID=3067903 RepID=UPI002741EDAB|nr:malonic semialdehyde reductase [Pararhizobium sp. IMCC21322]